MTTVLGRVGVWGHLSSLDRDRLAAYARRVEELGYGTLWVPETVAREPFSLLATLACGTRRLRLGTSIASIWARDAVTMRGSALTLQDLSGGRFVLGLGVSHHHLAEKVRGHVYQKPLTRMRGYLAAYRAAPWRGPAVEQEPPVVLAALRRRMLELAAHEADGAFPYLVTSERVRWMREVLDTAAPGRAERPLLAVTLPVVLTGNDHRGGDGGDDGGDGRTVARAYLAPYLRTPNYKASWAEQGFGDPDWEQPGSDALVDAMVAVGDRPTIAARLEAMVTAGADHVAIIPLGPGAMEEHLPTVEALADIVGG